MSPTPQVQVELSSTRKDPERLELAVSSCKVWTFATEKKLYIYFMGAALRLVDRVYESFDDWHVPWAKYLMKDMKGMKEEWARRDPRIKFIMDAIQDWTKCTGVEFEVTEDAAKANIRVSFGCPPPKYDDVIPEIRSSLNQWFKKKLRPDFTGGLDCPCDSLKSEDGWHVRFGHGDFPAVYTALAERETTEEKFEVIRTCLKEDYNHSGEDSGSWSYVGTDAKKIPLEQPTMNFGFDCFGCMDLALLGTPQRRLWQGTVLHEFGHALGFEHEHTHGVPFDEAKTISYYGKLCGWSEEKIRRNVLKKSGDLMQSPQQLDMLSIMSYSVDPEVLDKSVPGWEAYIHGQNSELSALDKEWARLAYN